MIGEPEADDLLEEERLLIAAAASSSSPQPAIEALVSVSVVLIDLLVEAGVMNAGELVQRLRERLALARRDLPCDPLLRLGRDTSEARILELLADFNDPGGARPALTVITGGKSS